MKRLLLIAGLFTLSFPVFAEHITGGEMYYTLSSHTGNSYTYFVTLKLFRNCGNVGAQLDPTAAIGIFDAQTGTLLGGEARIVDLVNTETIQLTDVGPCIVDPPLVCYEVGYYTFSITLPGTLMGYTIAYQRCCRISGINNLFDSGNLGATYTAQIPGTQTLATAPENNSAKFIGEDAVLVCGGYPFTYNFGARDADAGDVLRYSFCNAYIGGSGGPNNQAAPNPPTRPPYTSVNYAFGYGAGSPMGANVTINPSTGLITGTSPPEGIYVVTVCVQEIRNGVVIATQRKDIQIKAGGCRLAKPALQPNYITCDGFFFAFDQPDNSLINTYDWNFGDPATGADNSSAAQSPSHVFSAPGVYNIKVVANRGQDCSDSSIAVVKVYPGFFPDFSINGICLTNPVQFTDLTTTNFGTVNSWSWSFDEARPGDREVIQNPQWTYATTGTKTVTLIVGSDVGCIDTIQKTVDIVTKPPITLAFRDTLICNPDDVQLMASGAGNFSWTPAINIVQSNTATPTVSPTSTTTYFVHLDEQGCINDDSVRVRVVDFVTLGTLNDPTTICLTDSVQLHATGDALHFAWTPAATIGDPTLQDPMVKPAATTTYTVTGNIGTCTATDQVTVITVPYPQAQAGPDTAICYNASAMLHGAHNGSSFTWTPINSLANPTTLNPVASPVRTTAYVLSSFDNLGCPKPGRDTVVVSVSPRIRPFAGNDTLVVIGQSVQLNAEGGTSYIWSPPTGLNNPNSGSPVGVYDGSTDSIRYTVQVFNDLGCVDSAFVTVVVFKTNPYVFVPTGFTPNNDGFNDEIRPIAVGVKQINYFRIYNRWGQMVFSTTTNGKGWDGRIGGVMQGSNVFVWMVGATDYAGKQIFLKGSVTLIR